MAFFPPPAKPYTPYYSRGADPLEEHSQELDKFEPSDESGDELLEQPYSVDIELHKESDELGETDKFPDTVGGEILIPDSDSRVGLLLSIIQRGRYEGKRACLVKGRLSFPKGYKNARMQIRFCGVKQVPGPLVAQLTPRDYQFDDYTTAKVTKSQNAEVGVNYAVNASVRGGQTVERDERFRPSIVGKATGPKGGGHDTIAYTLQGNRVAQSEMPPWMDFAFVVLTHGRRKRFKAVFQVEVQLTRWFSNIGKQPHVWEYKGELGKQLDWSETLEGKNAEGLLLDTLVRNR